MCSCSESLFLATKLELEIKLYQEGILRVFVDEKEGPNPNRFRISDHDFGTIIEIDQL